MGEQLTFDATFAATGAANLASETVSKCSCLLLAATVVMVVVVVVVVIVGGGGGRLAMITATTGQNKRGCRELVAQLELPPRRWPQYIYSRGSSNS